MELEDLKHFRTEGPLVDGCFIMCPYCEVGSRHTEWEYANLWFCGCGCKLGVECPDCGATFCSEHSPEFDLAPPFP